MALGLPHNYPYWLMVDTTNFNDKFGDAGSYCFTNMIGDSHYQHIGIIVILGMIESPYIGDDWKPIYIYVYIYILGRVYDGFYHISPEGDMAPGIVQGISSRWMSPPITWT